MTAVETRIQLLDAAEQLIAERGYRGTSVRAITELAGANLAAVGYHFGSKAELVSEVARRVIEPITGAQLVGLEQLLSRHPDPSIAQLVEAFVGPMFDGISNRGEGGARASRLIVMILTDPAVEMRGWTGVADAEVRERFYAEFERALPGISAGELWFRMRGILAVVAVDRVEFTAQRLERERDDAARDWAITFLAAAVSAPASR